MADLDKLSPAELRKLMAAAADELAVRALDSGASEPSSLMRLWHEPITDALKNPMAFQTWSRGPGKHAGKHLAAAESFVPKFFRRGGKAVGVEQRYFARLIVVEALVEYLRSIDVHPTVSVVSKNMGSAVDAVEFAFPGYARSGFLPAVYDRYTSR